MYFEWLFTLPKPYLLFAALRIILTCVPQTGYIHPDEFFQSIEVMAEKALELEVRKPWEFNVTFPVRSIMPAYMTVGMSFQVLKILNMLLSYQFHINIMSPYYVLMFPRLFFCIMSFIVDWCLIRICMANSEKYKSRCIILSLSYVMIVYATRTFSNAIELVLFALLLYFVAESLIFSTVNVRQREYLNIRYAKAKTTVDKVKFHKLKFFLEDDSLRSCFIIATICVAGFFNRPTFVAYAVSPVFLWLYRGIGSKVVNSLNFHWRILIFLLCTAPSILIFILIDSLYFGYLTWGEVGVLQVTVNNFVVTPFNFIKYNIKPSNLAQHGLHPRYLHALVNIPLLFNVLGALALYNVINLFNYLLSGKYNYLPTIRSLKGLMMASFLTPLALLSVFPHQEPRFLIPLVLPLVYLYGSKILPEKEYTVIKYERRTTEEKSAESYFLFKIWIGINFLLVVFYGFLHQGGVLPLMQHLHKEMRYKGYSMQFHVVTSHTYSLPESLVLQRSEALANPYAVNLRLKKLHLHELGAEDLDKTLQEVKRGLKSCTSTLKCKVYLVIPSSLKNKLKNRYKEFGLAPISTNIFFPHFSTEAMPDLWSFFSDYEQILIHPFDFVTEVLQMFGLACIEVVIKK